MFVIDDDANVRTSIEGLLEETCFRAILFDKAEDFLCDVRLDGPSCIILDMSLPGINGLDFQQRLRKAGVRIPIIFLTAYGDIPMTVRALKSGAVEFFTTPIDDEDLLDKQIALELGTSLITIKVHRAQGMHKMQAESLLDLVRIAEKLQLIRRK